MRGREMNMNQLITTFIIKMVNEVILNESGPANLTFVAVHLDKIIYGKENLTLKIRIELRIDWILTIQLKWQVLLKRSFVLFMFFMVPPEQEKRNGLRKILKREGGGSFIIFYSSEIWDYDDGNSHLKLGRYQINFSRIHLTIMRLFWNY